MEMNLDNQKQDEDVENKRIMQNFQQWQQRLQEYVEQIENNSFDELNIEKLLNDVYFCEYYAYFDLSKYNEYNSLIKKSMPKLAPQIARFYGCEPCEICFGSYNLDIRTEKFPYVVVFGDVFLKSIDVTGVNKLNDVTKLKIVSGALVSNCEQITSFPNLVYANSVKTFCVTSFPNLTHSCEIEIRVDAETQTEIDLSKLQIADDITIKNLFSENEDCIKHPVVHVKLDSLKECSSLNFNVCNVFINSLDKLTKCGMLDVKKATIKSMKNLKEVDYLEIDDTVIENMTSSFAVKNNLIIKYHDFKHDNKSDINELRLTKKDEKIIEKISSVEGMVFSPYGKFDFVNVQEKIQRAK